MKKIIFIFVVTLLACGWIYAAQEQGLNEKQSLELQITLLQERMEKLQAQYSLTSQQLEQLKAKYKTLAEKEEAEKKAAKEEPEKKNKSGKE